MKGRYPLTDRGGCRTDRKPCRRVAPRYGRSFAVSPRSAQFRVHASKPPPQACACGLGVRLRQLHAANAVLTPGDPANADGGFEQCKSAAVMTDILPRYAGRTWRILLSMDEHGRDPGSSMVASTRSATKAARQDRNRRQRETNRPPGRPSVSLLQLRRERRYAYHRARSAFGRTQSGHAGLFPEMPGKARLRSQRAESLCVRHGEARSFRRHVQRPDARPIGPFQARARNDRGRGVVPQPLLLLSRRAWRSGARAVR